MKLLKNVDTLLKIILHKKIIKDYNPYKIKSNRHALFYYSTSWYYPFFLRKPAKGTTIYEAMSMVKIINRNGFIVDIIDRTVNEVDLTRKYDLFFGQCVWSPGRLFTRIMDQLDDETVTIAYSAGPENRTAKKRDQERIEYFKKRKGVDNVPYDDRVGKLNHDEALKRVDAIFYCGYSIVPESYNAFNAPKYRIVVPINDDIISNHYEIIKNKYKFKKTFLYYSGGGILRKGLDLLLDIFSKREDIELHVCSSSREKEFIDFYKEELYHKKNIHFHGNVKEHSSNMQEITGQCGFVISPTCCDGDPAAVAVCMRYGLVPVVTKEADISFKDAIIINNYFLDEVEETINKAVSLSDSRFTELVKKSIEASVENSTCTLNYSFEKSLISVLNRKIN